MAGRGEDGAEDALGDLRRQPERAGTLHAEEDRDLVRRRRLEPDIVEVEAAAVNGHPLSPEQAPDDRDGFPEIRQGGLEADPHLRLDPPPVTAGKAQHDAPRCRPGQRRRLHREESRVARIGVHDAEADGGPLGDGGRGAGQGEDARMEVVLDEPEAAQPRALGRSRPSGYVRRRLRARQRHAEAIGPGPVSQEPLPTSRQSPPSSAGCPRRSRSRPRLRSGSPGNRPARLKEPPAAHD